MARKVKVRGVPQKELSTEDYGLVLWLQAKRVLRERREREEKERAKRRGASR